MKKIYVWAALIVTGSLWSQSQNNAFSLQQAIEYAYKNSPNIQNTELDEKLAVYRKNEIAGIGLPQVTGSADFKDYIEIPTSLFPVSAFNPFAPPDAYQAVKFGLKYNATAGVSASQLIFSSDYIFGLKASKQFIGLSKINTRRAKDELVAQVSKAYYGVLVNRERLKLLDINGEKLNKSLSDLKAYNAQGLVEMIDVERVEVASNNLEIEKEKVKELLNVGENLLKFQMGYKMSDPVILTDSLNLGAELNQELPTQNADISKRSDYQLLKAQQNLLDLDVKRLKWGYLPTLAAYGSYQLNTQRPTPNIFESDKNNAAKQWYKIALIGATLNLNIFDGMQRHYKIQQAKITADKNINTLRNVEMAAQFESGTAGISFNNALKTLKISKRNMELARHVYDVAQKKFMQGVGSNLELITAESSLRESEVNYYNAVYDVLVARIDYQKATGTLVK
ncbi:MAG: outer rane efflux protein [Bacteroidetes bacterium]|jgi:outer membrane protein TolC|nr:outer rane efflux protein [Bacteroidota bacterium]